jgi:ABC-type transport system involved in multi-copper enzyme maturation permease subunit
MIPALRSEFKKLLTVRSTYIVTALVLLFMCFIAFYVEGWRLKPSDLHNPMMLTSDVFGGLSLSIFSAIIAILLVTHEYRYNTIIYTLAGSNSRSRVLAAKVIVVSCYALFLTVLLGIISPVASYLGVHAAGHSLVPQTLHYTNIIWRSLFYGWAYGMAGLLLALLIRVQIGAVVAVFILPGLVESLLAQLLNKNSVYLPFTALANVIGDTGVKDISISPARGALVFAGYLAVGWIVAWYLFLRRDAS